MVKRFKALFTIFFVLFSITAGWAAAKTWTGAVDTDWDKANNWSPTGVPNAGDTVIINSGGNQPVIENKEFHLIPTTKEISITKLTINENAKLTIVSKKNDVKLVCTSGIINNGTIILDLNRYTKKIEFTKTDFQGESEIYIDAPFTTPIAYSVSFISNTQIDFKTNSVVTAEYGHDDDILVINTSKLNVIGSFTSERRLEIQNASGVELNITGTLTAKRSVTVPDNATTKITSPGSVNLEKTVDWNNVIWNASGGTITTKGDFQVKKFSQSNSGTLRLIGEKQKLHIKEVYNLEIADSNTAAKPAVLQGNLIISGSFTNNGNFEANGQTVTFNGDNSKIMGSKVTTFSDLRIESSKKLTLEQNIKIGGAFHNDGTFEPASYKVSFTGNPCEVRGASNTTFYDFEVESGAVCKIHRDITVKNSFTNAGTFNAAGTQRTVYLEPPAGGTVTLTGTNNQNSTKFHSIKCENAGGKTLKIKRKISVEKELVLSGTASPASYLTIDSDANGEIHLKTNDNGIGNYLDIKTSKVGIRDVAPISASDWGYTVYNSQKNGVSASGVHDGWKFIGGSPPPPFTGTLYWIGKTDTGWETAGNWAEESGSVYTVSSHIPSYNTEVFIPQKNSITISGTTYPERYPKLTNDFKAKSVEIKKDANSSGNNGMLDLSAYVITAGFSKNAKIENYGTLKLAGTTAQKTWFGAANDEKIHLNDDTCIVEYYGNSPANPTIWGGPYQNLRVGDAKTGLNTGSLVVNGYFTVVHDVGANFTVTADSQHYKNSVFLYKPTIFTSNSSSGTIFEEYITTNGSSITFDGSGTIQTKKDITIAPANGDITLNTGTGAWTSTGAIQARDITVNSGTGAWTSSGGAIHARDITVYRDWTANSVVLPGRDLTVEGTWRSNGITAGRHIIARGNWTSNAFVMTHGNITADNASHDNTWTAGDVTLKGSLTAAQFNQTSGALTFNGNGTLQTLVFTNLVGHNIQNLIIDKNSGQGIDANVSLSSSITIAENFTNKGTFNAGTHTVTLAPAGSTVTITGIDTGSNPEDKTTFRKLSLRGAVGKILIINGKITVDDLDISGTSGSKLTVQGSSPADFNIKLTDDQIPDPVSKKGYYLDVRSSVPINDGHIYYVAESDLDTPNPKNWQHMTYTWKTTAATTAWGTPANWTPEIIPTAYWPVIIPAGANNYPILFADASAQSVTVDANAELTLGNSVIKKGSGSSDFAKLTNYGTIKLTGTGNQKNWFGAGNDDKIDLKAGSTVEYYGTSTANVWEGPYQKLKISGAKQNLNASSLTVNKDLIITRSPVVIITSGKQTYHGNVLAYEGASYYQLTLATTGTGTTGTIKTSRGVTTGNLTVNGKWEAGDQNNSATVEVNGDLNVSGDIASVNSSITAKKVSGSGGDITVNGTNEWRCWGDITAEGNMTIHNMKATGGTIAVHGNMTAYTFHLADWGKLYFNGSSPQNLNFTDTAGSQIRELEIGSSSTLNLASPIKITEILTNNGIFAAGNYTVTLGKATPIGSGVTAPTRIAITGTSAAANTQFKDLICTDSYIKTLTIDNNISVTGSLKLEGQSAASPLTVAGGTSVGTGSPHIALTAANTAKGQFLNVETDIAITGGPPVNPYTYTAENSIPIGSDSDIQAGKPDNWIFTNYGALEWAGTVDSDWHNRRNWSPPYAIPGKDTVVTIPRKPSPAPPSHDYPKLTKAGEAKSITIAEKASLDLAGFVITKGAGADAFTPLTNNGTLKMTGTTYPSPAPLGGQKEWLTGASGTDNKITHGNKSAIEYYGTSADVVWKGPYKNLILNSRPDLNIQNEDLVVEKKLTITGSPAHINTGTGTQIYQGEIDAKKSAEPHWNIEFTASSLTMEKGTETLNINAEDIKVNADTWTSSANINAASITASGSWTTKKGNINLRGGLSAGSFEQEKGILTLGGSGGTLKYTSSPGTAKIKNLVIASSATVNLGSDIIITEKFENKGTFNAITSLSPLSGHTVTLEHGAADTISIIGNDDKDKTKFFNIKCENAKKKTIRFANKVSVYGNLTLSGRGEDKDNRLNLVGTTNDPATIYINGNKDSVTGSDCTYLGINIKLPIKSTVSEGDEFQCTVKKSTPTGASENQQELIDGDPKNWIFEDTSFLIWVGQTADWNDVNNWRPLPNHKPKETQSLTIRGNVTNYPILGQGLTPHEYYAKEITVKGDATLDLADKVIYSNTAKTATAKLEAKGTLKLKGTQNQKSWFEQTAATNKMTVTQSAAVEYYDNTDGFIWGNGTDGYNKLILNSFSGKTENNNLKVNGDLTVKGLRGAGIDSGTANQTYGKNIDAQDGGNLRPVTLKGSNINVNGENPVITAVKFTVDGDFTFNGTKITAAEQTYKKSVKFNHNIDLQASTSVKFEDFVTCSGNLTLSSGSSGTGMLTVEKAGGTPVTISAQAQSYAGQLTLNVPVTFDTPGALTFKKGISGTGSLTVSNNGPVYIAENIALTGSSSEFTQTGSGTVLLSAGIQTENGITFAGPLYINAASVLNAGTGKNVTAKNVFVAAHDGTTNKTVELQSPLQTDNFVLFSGNIKLPSGQTAPYIFANQDIVLFGPDYNGDYTPPSGASETTVVSNLFTYNHTSRPAPTIELPNKLPDTGNTAIQTPKGTFDLTSLAGKTLKANRNFYANGMDLCASSEWKLEIPVYDKSDAGFTEAYDTKVKNCKVVGGGTVAAAEGCSYKLSGDPANTANTNSGWDFTRPTIKRAYTVWDDVIYIEFSEPIENSRNEIATAVSRIKLNDGADIDVRVWKNEKCTDSTEGAGDLMSFYLKSFVRWNTDATGSSAGNTQSTDMGRLGIAPEHRSIKPNINIATVVSGLYETLRDKNKNRITDYSGTNRFTAVQDNCPPVLIGVYTGQEMHRPHDGSLTGGGGQPEYDAHNFIEFRYSEPVVLYEDKDKPDSAEYAPSNSINKRATDELGNITANGSGLKIAGFADIASGKVDAASRDGGIPHSLYRNFPAAAGISAAPAPQTHRVRLSIAGYVDSHISDPSAKVKIEGKEVHDWIGYINEAQTPSGAVTAPDKNKLVRSVNACDTDGSGAKRVPAVQGPYPVQVVNTGAENELYGSWDTSAPVFAKFSQNRHDWTDGSKEKEIVGFHSVSNISDKMEFHFFDNVPDYSSSRWWRSPSKVNAPGWFEENNPVPNTAYDTLGGSRPASSASAPPNITRGGIRASSLAGSLGSFSFKKTENHTGNPYRFETGLDTIKQRVQSTGLFAQAPSPPPTPIDTLYLQLAIKDYSSHAFTVSETFSVAYDGAGFVTDLAGNRMKAVSFDSASTVSMVAPRIVLTIAPAGTDKMYILFNTRINTDPEILKKIPLNLQLNGTGVPAVDTSIPAVVRTETRAGTGIIVRLTEKVKGNYLPKGMVELKTGSGPMHIEQSLFGLPAATGHTHALSDFAVNVIRPLHIYDNNPDGGLGIQSLESGLAMRIFDGSGGNRNTVVADKDLIMGAVLENGGTAAALKMHYDINPLSASISTVFNKATGLKSRVWLPERLDALSFTPNSSATKKFLDLKSSGASSAFSSRGAAQPFKFEPDKTVQFLFALQENDGSGGFRDIKINHDGDSSTPEVPLYALRLKDPEDPTSIDLWYFNTAALKFQRGGVTVLNNVINTAERESVVVQVQTEKAGSLSVIVMTADGDVVRILHSGRAEKGEHIYIWNGTNKNGDSVARGMYFIRVIGPNIDETRKVMAVKE